MIVFQIFYLAKEKKTDLEKVDFCAHSIMIMEEKGCVSGKSYMWDIPQGVLRF